MTLINIFNILNQRFQQLVKFSRQAVARYPWLIAIAIILLVYARLPLTYFEQDEWQAFETYINQTGQPISDCLAIQRPLTCVINRIEWRLFGLNAVPYAFFSLFLISAAAVAFYRWLRQWPIPPYKAIVAASLFPLLAVGSQAITWFGAFSASLPSFLFALLALNFFTNDLNQPAWRWQVLTILSAAISLYFKEDSLWLLPVMAATWWALSYSLKKPPPLFDWRPITLSALRHLGLIFLLIVGYIVSERLRQTTGQSFLGLVSTTDTISYRRDVLSALVLLPFEHLSHLILPPEIIVALITVFQQTIRNFSAELSIMIYAIMAFLLMRQAANRPLLFTLLVWLVTAFAPYAIFGKNPEFLEGRYYFGAQAPFMAFLVISLLPDRFRKIVSLNTIGTAVVAMVIIFNLLIINYRFNRSVDIGQQRRHILSFIQKATGPLPKKAIIFAETPNYGYVGLADYILPFQNGLGTTLRVVYHGKDQDYRRLSKKQGYLWNIVAEGYDEDEQGVGFGYYRHYEKLLELLNSKDELTSDMVYSFKWLGGPDMTIVDTTQLLRGRILVDQKQKIAVPKIKWKIKTSNDAGIDAAHGVEKLLDNDPKSDWSTKHKEGAFIEVDLGEPVNRVGVVRLKTADGNSFPKLYRFDYSPDGTNWVEYFTEEGKVTSTAETPMIFAPQTIQKFRITIVDKRDSFFDWSASDINVFTIVD